VSWQRNWEMPGPLPPRATASWARPNFQLVNQVFEPIWDAVHVDRVDISGLESRTPESLALRRPACQRRPGRHQERQGHNHLMEAVALALREQPARIDAGSLARSASRRPARGDRPGGGDDAQPDTETCASLILQVPKSRAGAAVGVTAGWRLRVDLPQRVIQARSLIPSPGAGGPESCYGSAGRVFLA
jgi:hypothetical protein